MITESTGRRRKQRWGGRTREDFTDGAYVEEPIEQDQEPVEIPEQQHSEQLSIIGSVSLERLSVIAYQKSVSHSGYHDRCAVFDSYERRILLRRKIPKRTTRVIPIVNPRILAEANTGCQIDCSEHDKCRVEEQLEDEVLSPLLDGIVHEDRINGDMNACWNGSEQQ